jgi:uncharacterized membrane protein
LIAPFAFIGSRVSSDIAIYAFPNNGGWYDFGFLLGLPCWGGGGHVASRRARRRGCGGRCCRPAIRQRRVGVGIAKAAQQQERLVPFGDGAITIALLVLDIRLPDGAGEPGDAALWEVLCETWPQVRGDPISFAVIGALSPGHHQKLSVITRPSRGLLLTNLLFLCCIGVVPFVTGLLAENPGVPATLVHAALMTACALSLALIRLFAILAGLIDPAVPAREQWLNRAPALPGAVAFAGSIPIARVDPDLVRFCWLLLLPISILQRPSRQLRQDRAA